jgi:integrase
MSLRASAGQRVTEGAFVLLRLRWVGASTTRRTGGRHSQVSARGTSCVANVRRAIQQASRRAGLLRDGQELVGAHDLRHSLAGCAFALGLSPVEVSKMLRHANPQVTMTVHAGMAEGATLAAGDKLAAALN